MDRENRVGRVAENGNVVRSLAGFLGVGAVCFCLLVAYGLPARGDIQPGAHQPQNSNNQNGNSNDNGNLNRGNRNGNSNDNSNTRNDNDNENRP